jgi:uncharacterized membrane protein
MKRLAWGIFALLCITIGLYPSLYLIIDREFGLLSNKTDELLGSATWNIGFYSHIIFGGIALLIGWVQFSSKWRIARPALHRNIGKVYVAAVLLSATAGVFIGMNATGGIVSQSGFIILGLIWFASTLLALLQIRKGNIIAHQKLMIFSYAACFAAVTLRLWLPLLIMLHKGEFEPAYRIVAWLCWVPNLLVAWWIVNRLEQKTLATS